ncbi:tRNA (adenosine(37)-N6)-threonylcarbamoyltransferase complex transferase subunit TsaD [Candidatus Saccharibacteria bacterium]|nr:MAG: tRNA (adenosine(37)-N6)-threonylcarbamoyltransferase complex transferase subunit TsaD [Candidatus Saccharibacteria bacterium]
MKVLGIESSCDETSAAVIEDGRVLLSNVVNSQIDIHAVFGGVVPEVAARSHLEVVLPVIQKALDDSSSTWDDIDAIAVTYAPGLVGSLLIGSLAARTLALLKNKPLIPAHHVEGHVYANFLLDTPPPFPCLALIVSGGHSQLVLFRDHGDYELLGQTQDDAVGEAFDKVARIIGLPYPGGPSVARAAESGDPRAYEFPKAKMPHPYDFSFSGLKTAVLRAVQREVGVDHTFPSHELAARLNASQRDNFAASFQRVAIETLVEKTIKAYHDLSPASVVIAGGVAANQELRRQLAEALPIPIEYAPMNLCTDNAAMIGALGYYMFEAGLARDPRDIEVVPSLSMTKTSWKSEAVK